jgi:hypothetical protein
MNIGHLCFLQPLGLSLDKFLVVMDCKGPQTELLRDRAYALNLMSALSWASWRQKPLRKSGRSMEEDFISLGNWRCAFTQYAPAGRLEQNIYIVLNVCEIENIFSKFKSWAGLCSDQALNKPLLNVVECCLLVQRSSGEFAHGEIGWRCLLAWP